MMEVATPVKDAGQEFGIGAPVALGGAASGAHPWRRPVIWLVVGLALVAAALFVRLQHSDIPWLADFLAVLMGLSAVGALAFAAWTAGRMAGRDSTADLMLEAARLAPEADLLIAGDGRVIRGDSRFGRFFFLLGDLADPLDGIHRIVNHLADGRLLCICFKVWPTGFLRHPEDVDRAIFVRVFWISAR